MALLKIEMYFLSLGADFRRFSSSEMFSSHLNILAEKQVLGYKCAAGLECLRSTVSSGETELLSSGVTDWAGGLQAQVKLRIWDQRQ